MDFTSPAVGQNYSSGYTAAIITNQKDLGQWLDSVAIPSPTGLVAGIKRYNATNQIFERRNAGNTAWEELPLAYAKLASPTFTGTPLSTTAAVDTNTTQIATCQFVLSQAGSANPLMNGAVAVGTSTRFSRQDHVHPVDTSRAPLNSPNFTGTPQVGGATIYHTGNLSLAGYAPLASPSFSGAVTNTGGVLQLYGYSGQNGQAVIYFGSSGTPYLYYQGTYFIFNGGNVYAPDFIISSDETVKEEIEPIRDPLDIVNAMEGIRFKYRKDGRRSIGFGARRTRKVLPELVYEQDDGKLAMTYGQITAVHNEAIKEIAMRLAAVEAR